ncbi:hypothetical protein [Candidatus Contubernalis alkaliaceticus]|uniref:hypothetical protein n=1 Tax=Candidatus Contubernalis alkaliaceticus TaxID=338645 RepID=UPI001F4C24C3|nr:hypothetical protein [Candidatus Contubernalis alkalaceticus]UNC91675.1 hypothetical protein HUE98_05955 [Candidatus Contubernalis alkalaceticus]
MALKESDIRKQVVDYLRITGWFVYHNLQGLGCYAGLSDIVAVKNGNVVHIELKAPEGKQRKEQVTFQTDLEAAGGLYVLADCIEDVMFLNKAGSGQVRRM